MQATADNIYILVLLGMAGIAILIIGFILLQVHQQNKVLLQKRKLQQTELRYQKELLHAVIDSQEAERKRIGMDLHDEVGASLSLLRLLIESHQAEGADGPAEGGFHARSKTSIDTIINSVRNIAHDLSPRLDGRFGLYDALLDLSDKVNVTPGLEMAVGFDGEAEAPVLPGTVALGIYRVIKELVNNTMKHAGATHIRLELEAEPGGLRIRYHDNGRGLAAEVAGAKKGIGIKNIESRLGMMEATWEEVAGAGYGIQFRIPINQQS